MKKIFMIGALLSMFAVSAMAQHRAIGARLSYTLEVSYQREAGSSNFWEFDAGVWNNFKGAQASGIYNWIIATPDWTPKGEWNWYLGVGAGVGLDWNRYNVEKDRDELGAFVGVAGLVGLEYTFWFPLQLSADFRPMVGPYFGDGVSLNGDVLIHALWPTLSARYKF